LRKGSVASLFISAVCVVCGHQAVVRL